MVPIPIDWTSFELGSSEPNEVASAGRAYLDAARIYRVRLLRKKKKMFFFVPEWYVIHHLSFISVELFLKSFGAQVYHTVEGDDSGPYDMYTVNGYHHHGLNDGGIPSSVLDKINDALSPLQRKMLKCLFDQAFAKAQLGLGRYPYERNKWGSEYPSSESGRKMAEDWLNLAKEICRFRTGSVFTD